MDAVILVRKLDVRTLLEVISASLYEEKQYVWYMMINNIMTTSRSWEGSDWIFHVGCKEGVEGAIAAIDEGDRQLQVKVHRARSPS